MNILITILARAGSKGCPNKSTRLCAGKSLVDWTLELAWRWRDLPHGHDVRMIVSSDSSAVLGRAALIGSCERVVRPSELATDSAPKVPAIRHALEWHEEIYLGHVDVVIDLDATAPLRTLDDIDSALALFQLERPDCVLSCTQGVGRNPYFNLLEHRGTNTDTGLVRCKPLNIHNRQEAPDVYEANSSIYVYSRDFLMREDVNSPLDGVCIPYVMPDVSFWHVDSELDFEVVEFLLKRRHKS